MKLFFKMYYRKIVSRSRKQTVSARNNILFKEAKGRLKINAMLIPHQ